MFADLILVAFCIGLAVYGARQTVHTRHQLAATHKRRRLDR